MYFDKYNVGGVIVRVGFGFTKTWVRMPDGSILSFSKHQAFGRQIRVCVAMWMMRNERKLWTLIPKLAQSLEVRLL